MDFRDWLTNIEKKYNLPVLNVTANGGDEVYLTAGAADFRATCHALHKELPSPVMMLFATDERREHRRFGLYCVFERAEQGMWIIVRSEISEETPEFESLAKDIHSASLFEREVKEMFGVEPAGNPDARRLRLHDEVWPKGIYPLRKDFDLEKLPAVQPAEYRLNRIQGTGVFEVAVGPVHAGIIGPGHFRFSVAGEPVINLEVRLGFTHRGVEKLLENRTADDALPLVECVSGDTVAAHALAFVTAVEKINHQDVTKKARYLRAIALELERLYNHAAGIGGIALDVGFSFSAAFASLIKERILAANEQLTGSRYLKGYIQIGGVARDMDAGGREALLDAIGIVGKDLVELKEMLLSSGSFMDRVDGTGVLKKNVAEDLGITGLAARASGIGLDTRKNFHGIYQDAKFMIMKQESGDALARLKMRMDECDESLRLIREFVAVLDGAEFRVSENAAVAGNALGCAEGWRGPVLYWVRTGGDGRIDRCKIVDPSFHNWEGLAFAVPGNIIPDFPLCNKSFDLSYSGNDL